MAVGLVLMVGFRHYHGDSGILAGFLLGVLLLVIGAAGLLVSGTQAVGKKSNFVKTYYLVLKLTNGQEYPLFAPGRFYPGADSRATVETWRRRLVGYLSA